MWEEVGGRGEYDLENEHHYDVFFFFVRVKYEYAQTDFGLFGGVICNVSCEINHENLGS